MATLQDETTAAETDGRRRAVVRVVLWVALVASVLIAAWGTPRSASQDQMARALKAGDVRAIQTSDGRYGLEWTALSIQVRFGAADNPAVVLWEDARGMLHRTNLAALAGGTPGSPGDSIDVLATLGATAQQSGVLPPTVDDGLGRADYSAAPLGILTLVFLGILVLGPQPRRLTKWATLWVVCIPLGVGMGWWLLRDAPFAPAMNRAAEPLPGAKGDLPNGVHRTGGGVAFLAAWGVSILLGLAAALVIGLLGSTDGGASLPVEPWTLVPAPQQPFGP